jgi:hypothetical protein
MRRESNFCAAIERTLARTFMVTLIPKSAGSAVAISPRLQFLPLDQIQLISHSEISMAMANWILPLRTLETMQGPRCPFFMASAAVTSPLEST